ncbi:MAG: hypothetical protein NZ811_07355 [Gammaproteobacteria bacterium]|nr:hypothetical protein [Gammaproteobacteria bacterium]
MSKITKYDGYKEIIAYQVNLHVSCEKEVDEDASFCPHCNIEIDEDDMFYRIKPIMTLLNEQDN